MLTLSDIKPGKIILNNGQPYLVIKTDHLKVAMRGAVLKVKAKNLLTGNILDDSFHGAEKIEEADISTKKVNYLYRDEKNAYFMDNETFEQFELPLENLGGKEIYLKDGTDVKMMYFNDKAINLELPIKMDFKVISAPPAIRGNTAGNITKPVELETGAKIDVPIFINEGDVIKINTDSGLYVERVNQ
ncbi:MAG: elongation factor P [Patescibacteria group bacterium]|nr:elongation factor P [Patescibacteria group bacterium]